MYWQLDAASGSTQAVRMGEWKVVRPPGKTRRKDVELYHLSDDPGERRNVAEEFPKILDAFLLQP